MGTEWVGGCVQQILIPLADMAPGAAGSDGVVHVWDMRMRRCLSRNIDEGCFSSTALAASADSSLYATGSKAGVVNLYKYPHRLVASPLMTT